MCKCAISYQLLVALILQGGQWPRSRLPSSSQLGNKKFGKREEFSDAFIEMPKLVMLVRKFIISTVERRFKNQKSKEATKPIEGKFVDAILSDANGWDTPPLNNGRAEK